MQERFPHAKLFGPSGLSQLGLRCDRVLRENDIFQFGDREWQTFNVPGHTLDHLAFYSSNVGALAFSDQPPVLFCGDVLFSFGCGRIFEGTFAQMYDSLAKLKSLPSATQVYCAHEYTLNNLNFTIEYLQNEHARSPSHANAPATDYSRLREQLSAKRTQGLATVPTTIGFELRYNLFFRAQTPEDFTAVRTAKDLW